MSGHSPPAEKKTSKERPGKVGDGIRQANRSTGADDAQAKIDMMVKRKAARQAP